MAINKIKNNLIAIYTQNQNRHIALIQNTKNAMTHQVIDL